MKGPDHDAPTSIKLDPNVHKVAATLGACTHLSGSFISNTEGELEGPAAFALQRSQHHLSILALGLHTFTPALLTKGLILVGGSCVELPSEVRIYVWGN